METDTANFTVPVVISKNRLLFIFTSNFLCNPQSDEVEKHCHSFYEIHYYIKGSGVMNIADEMAGFGPGTLLLIHPETYHLEIRDKSSETLKYIFKFSVSSPPDRHDSILPPLLSAIAPAGYLRMENVTFAENILEDIRSEIAGLQKGYLVQIANDLSTLLIRLSRKCRPDSPCADESLVQGGDTPTETEIIIDHFFDQNYNRNVHCSDLCEQVHLSESQLSRILKSMYAMSFKEKHAHTRILYIEHLLSKPDLTVTEIAYKSGFDSVSSLSGYFRRSVGISPLEYRRQRRSL